MCNARKGTTMNKGYKFEPVKKDSIVIELTKRLMDYIFSGSIKPGDKLPAERVLSEALGVGRSAIREATKALTVLGILEVRQGDGTYVKKTDSSLLTQSIEWGLLLGERTTLDLIEARKEIEISIVRLAARRYEPHQLEELKAILDRMDTSDLTDFIENDVAFHFKVAEMSKNSVLKDILVSIQSLLRTWIKLVIESAGSSNFSYRDHLAVYEALARRDEQAAAAAMEKHMDDATRRLIEVLEKSNKTENEEKETTGAGK